MNSKPYFKKDLPKEFLAELRLVQDSLISAIEKAERFGTSIVIKEDGEIKHLTPDEMRSRLKKKK